MALLTTDPRVDPGSLVICSQCRAIRGPVPVRSGGAEQQCKCTPMEVRREEPVWGGDYNTYAELCRCCGLVLLPSGSRWSVWFCATCKPLITALNRAVGHYVIPIGRHSIMNRVSAPTAQLQNRPAVERLVDDMRDLFARIGGIEAYARSVVAQNLEVLGFADGTDVYLGKYLSTSRRSELTQQDAFAALVLVTMRPREDATPSSRGERR